MVRLAAWGHLRCRLLKHSALKSRPCAAPGMWTRHEVVFLSLGAFALLMIVPLGQHAAEDWAKGLGLLLVQSNTMAYQIGEAVLGFGALFLCALLFRTRLIPGWLAISGLIGYTFLMAGQIAEIFGIHIGLYLTIPGFFFELALPFWLFFKGFQPEAYGQDL
jgi:Domain of unknown function (DUF4386)